MRKYSVSDIVLALNFKANRLERTADALEGALDCSGLSSDCDEFREQFSRVDSLRDDASFYRSVAFEVENGLLEERGV